MNDLDVLCDLDALQQLKARYCRFLDTKEWRAWRALFTDDFVSDTSASGGRRVEGADAFVDFVRRMLGNRTTVHQVHAPELERTSERTARGVWALEDFVRFGPGLNMRGYGHYHETYEKSDGIWRLKTSRLTRLRGDLVTPILSLKIPDRVWRGG
jgi:hypothetical protein